MNDTPTSAEQRPGPKPPGTAGLVLLMMAKGGAYVLGSVVMWPALPLVITGRAPFGPSADPLAGVFGVLGATFAAAACLAFIVSRPRTPQPGLRKLMGVGAVAAAGLFVVQAAIAVDVIRRNMPAAPSGTDSNPGVAATAGTDAHGVAARNPWAGDTGRSD